MKQRTSIIYPIWYLKAMNVLAKFENNQWKITVMRELTGLDHPVVWPLGQQQYPGALKGCGVKSPHYMHPRHWLWTKQLVKNVLEPYWSQLNWAEPWPHPLCRYNRETQWGHCWPLCCTPSRHLRHIVIVWSWPRNQRPWPPDCKIQQFADSSSCVSWNTRHAGLYKESMCHITHMQNPEPLTQHIHIS